MVRQIKRAWPQARITILARLEPMAELFRRLPEVDEVLVMGNGWRGHWRTIAAARQRWADWYLVPFPSNRWQYSVLAATSRAKHRVLHGYSVGYWRALHVLPGATRQTAVRGIHDVVQNLNLLREMGIEPALTEAPTFAVNDADRARADALLGDVKDGPFVVVHAGSESNVLARAKRWPAQNYARLIDAMAREFRVPIVLLEGPAEAGVADAILLHVPKSESPTARILTVTLRGPIGDAAAVLERATLYVGSDSGLAHLAAAVGTRAVTLFASADPDRVSPFGQRDLVVRSPKNCGPCFLYPWHTPYPKVRCRPPYCIDSVAVDAVMEAAQRGMKKVAPQRLSS